jgi:hypothetical protein
MAIGSAFRAIDVVVLSADPARHPAVLAGLAGHRVTVTANRAAAVSAAGGDPQVIVVSHPDPAGWDGWALGELRGRCPHAWIVAVGVPGPHGDTLRRVTAADAMWDPDAEPLPLSWALRVPAPRAPGLRVLRTPRRVRVNGRLG